MLSLVSIVGDASGSNGSTARSCNYHTYPEGGGVLVAHSCQNATYQLGPNTGGWKSVSGSCGTHPISGDSCGTTAEYQWNE